MKMASAESKELEYISIPGYKIPREIYYKIFPKGLPDNEEIVTKAIAKYCTTHTEIKYEDLMDKSTRVADSSPDADDMSPDSDDAPIERDMPDINGNMSPGGDGVVTQRRSNSPNINRYSNPVIKDGELIFLQGDDNEGAHIHQDHGQATLQRFETSSEKYATDERFAISGEDGSTLQDATTSDIQYLLSGSDLARFHHRRGNEFFELNEGTPSSHHDHDSDYEPSDPLLATNPDDGNNDVNKMVPWDYDEFPGKNTECRQFLESVFVEHYKGYQEFDRDGIDLNVLSEQVVDALGMTTFQDLWEHTDMPIQEFMKYKMTDYLSNVIHEYSPSGFKTGSDNELPIAEKVPYQQAWLDCFLVPWFLSQAYREILVDITNGMTPLEGGQRLRGTIVMDRDDYYETSKEVMKNLLEEGYLCGHILESAKKQTLKNPVQVLRGLYDVYNTFGADVKEVVSLWVWYADQEASVRATKRAEEEARRKKASEEAAKQNLTQPTPKSSSLKDTSRTKYVTVPSRNNQDITQAPMKGYRARDLEWPTQDPPRGNPRASHFSGRWASKNGPNCRATWVDYSRPLEIDELPENCLRLNHSIRAHWEDKIATLGGKLYQFYYRKDGALDRRLVPRMSASTPGNQSQPQVTKVKAGSTVQFSLPNPTDQFGQDLSGISHRNSFSPPHPPSNTQRKATPLTRTTMTPSPVQTNTSNGPGTATRPGSGSSRPWIQPTTSTRFKYRSTNPVTGPGPSPGSHNWANTAQQHGIPSGQSHTYTPYGGSRNRGGTPYGTRGRGTPSSSHPVPGGGSGTPSAGNTNPFPTWFGGGSNNPYGRGGPPYGGPPHNTGGGGSIPPGGGGPPFNNQGGFPSRFPSGNGGGGMPPGGGGNGGSPYTLPTSMPTKYKPPMKCDIKAFTKLKDIANYDPWFKDTMATLRAQGIDIVLDPNYQPDPNSYDENVEWDGIQAFSYAMLRYTVRPIELRQYVDAHSEDSDAQRVFILMTDHVRNSTYAIIVTREMLQEIITTRLNFKTWTKSAYEFVVTLDQMFELYNNQQSNVHLHINESMKRTYMQNALMGIRAFQEVTDRETDRMIMGGTPFNYNEYMTAVKSVASKIDVTRKSKNSRDVNLHLLDDEGIEDIDVPSKEYDINEVKRKFRNPSDYASQMNKETWTSLSKDTQEIWDNISKEDKAKLLNYGMKRAERATKVNVHELDDKKDITANAHEFNPPEEDPGNEESKESTNDNGSINVNNVLTGIRSEAHAGDPRRMMGTSQPAVKKSLEARMARLYRNYEGDESSQSSSESDESEQDFRMGGR
jgi:hypothetical protein